MLSATCSDANQARVSLRPRGRAGFTLIELLVVIAIIAILAAILFPVFAQARGKARQAKCLSNCKQIGLALMQYTQDYDETYPVNNWTYGKGWQGCQLGWMQHLQGYMKNSEVFVCPDSVFNDPTSGNDYATIPGVNGVSAGSLKVPVRDLGANEWVVSSVSSSTPNGVLSWKGNINMAQIGKPADLPMVADSTFGTFIDAARIMNPNWIDPSSTGRWWTYPVVPVPKLARHNGGSTIVYGDGHAKWVNQIAMQWDSTLIQQNNNTPCPATPQVNNPWCWKLPMHPADKRLQ